MARSTNSKFDLPIDYITLELHGEIVTVRQYHRSYKNRTKSKMTSTARTPKSPPMTAGQMKREGFIK
jgi:hypothetical protein